ncbi:MAG: cupin domain-containing protein [Acidobacteriota bacterium]
MTPIAAGTRPPVFLLPGEGRGFPMGRISSVFKAGANETANAYSISEWFVDPHTTGPGPHNHPEDDVFYIIEGTMSVFVGDRWFDAPRGSLVIIPGGTTHDFENRGDVRAGLLNLKMDGAFEEHLSGIAQWFRENPPGDTR